MAVVKEINLNKFAKEFGTPSYDKGRLLKRQKKHIYESVYEGCLKSVEPMAERSPVDTGLYASAWSVRKINKNEIHFGNTAPYASVIELGAKPHKAPLQPLIEWSARQLQVPADDPEAKRMGLAVMKKIEREGMEPKYVLENGLEEVIIPMIKKEIKRRKDKYENSTKPERR